MNTDILKIGGSVVTDKKSGRPMLRARAQEIAREVARARLKKKGHLIILYGGGSFGHPLAYRHRLRDRSLSVEALVGAGYTISSMRELGNHLAALFLDVGIPVVPLQTSSFVSMRRGRLHFSHTMIETILKNGGVPLLGGDVVFSDRRTAIASADTLAAKLAKKFKKTRLFFATDVDGVYTAFPPRINERPIAVLDRVTLKNLLKRPRANNEGTDVTGAMQGKLRALLDVHSTTAMIFNGNTRGVIVEVLSGKKKGTQIRL
ncbi:MAG: isopentenyl phosphate kinase [Patescibacteria group bacterium]